MLLHKNLQLKRENGCSSELGVIQFCIWFQVVSKHLHSQNIQHFRWRKSNKERFEKVVLGEQPLDQENKKCVVDTAEIEMCENIFQG